MRVISQPISAGATAVDHRRPGATLYRALLREMLVPTFYTLLVLSAMLLTRELLGYSKLVINHGLSLRIVAGIALYQTVPVIAATLPFSMLVGCLGGLGRLGADRELLAIEACAISPPRLVGPVLTFAALVSGVALLVSLQAAPWANRQFDAALETIARESPTASISAGHVQKFGEWRVLAREVSSTGEHLRGVMMWVPSIGETAFAESGKIQATPTGVRLELENATVVLDPRGDERVLHFDRFSTELNRKRSLIERNRFDQLAGSSLIELSEHMRAADPNPRFPLRAAMELHRRFAMPVAPLALGLLCVPLFLSRAHFSRAGGGGLGAAATLVYYGLVQLGNGLIQNGTVGPAFGIWLPNIVVGSVGGVMFSQLTRQSAFGRHAERRSSGAPRAGADEGDDANRPLRVRRWALQRYVARLFMQMLGLAFAAVLMGYFLVDLLEKLEWFADKDPTLWEFLQFYAARLPLLASQILPMALLVATAMTVSLLATDGEITAMRACGIPAIRGLLPVLAICALVTPLYFLFNDLVLPRANAYYSHVRNAVIIGKTDEKPSAPTWYLWGNSVYEALELDSDAGTATDLKIYELGDDWLPVSRVDARSGRSIGGGHWRLEDPVHVEIEHGAIRRVRAETFARLGDGLNKRVRARHMSTSDLQEEIEDVETGGLSAVPLRVAYWLMWATPVSCLILPALALFFSISGPPYPTLAAAGILCVVVAVSFTLLSGVATSLGTAGVLSPWLAGWAPAILYAAIAAFFGWRLPGSGRTS